LADEHVFTVVEHVIGPVVAPGAVLFFRTSLASSGHVVRQHTHERMGAFALNPTI
jgi:hypothetical protein